MNSVISKIERLRKRGYVSGIDTNWDDIAMNNVIDSKLINTIHCYCAQNMRHLLTGTVLKPLYYNLMAQQ